MNKGETLMFGEIIVKIIDVEYYHDADLEIRYIHVRDVKLFFSFFSLYVKIYFLFEESC
jgi:hypothetical protein